MFVEKHQIFKKKTTFKSIKYYRFIVAVPEKPQNLSVLEVTSTTIKISWKEPLRLNGAIHGYRVYSVSNVKNKQKT